MDTEPRDAAPDAKAPNKPQPPRPIALRRIMPALLAGVALAAAVIVALRPRGRTRVVAVIEGAEAEAFGVNRGEIHDTLREPRAAAKVGRRYRVRIEDESDDRASGVARIGGLVTFVPGARRGQIAVIEVTAVRARAANAALVRVEAAPTETAAAHAPAATTAPAAPREPEVRAETRKPAEAPETEIAEGAASSADDVRKGRLFRVRITERSRQNPDTEAVARIGGLVTIVRGGRVGERAVIRIVERRERVAFAEVARREEE